MTVNIFDGQTWQTVSVNRPPRGDEGEKLWAQCLASAVAAKMNVKRAWAWVDVARFHTPENGRVRLTVRTPPKRPRRSFPVYL